MFKKTIMYEDFNGNKKTQDFYFHMSKAEMLALAASNDDMQARIRRIIEANDGAAILQEFRELIKMACGVRSADGERFIKDAEAQSTLLDSPAFDELLMELATNAGAASEFVQQLIPEKMQKEMQEQLKKSQNSPNPFAEAEDNRPAYQKEHRQPTQGELVDMSREELAAAWKWREELGK